MRGEYIAWRSAESPASRSLPYEAHRLATCPHPGIICAKCNAPEISAGRDFPAGDDETLAGAA